MRKTAIITGASRGIGFSTALSLEAAGYNVVLCSRSANKNTEEFSAAHRDTVAFVAADIGDERDRAEILRTAKSRFGRLDVLINNAAVAPRTRRDMLEISLEDYDYVMNINLRGTYFLTSEAVKLIAEQGKGYVINMGSISADTVSVNRAEYCVSKAGVRMLTQLFAVRLAALNIGVFEISPGVIDTDMIAPVKEKYDAMARNGDIPAGRLGSGEDVAKAVLSIVGGALDYATGTIIRCDGGLHIPTL